MGNIDSIQLHEMESPDCNLSCSGCYLKGYMGGPHMNIHNLLSIIEGKALISVYSAFYMNNLDRDPNKATGKSRLLKLLENKGCMLQKRTLVTDSVTATDLTKKNVFKHFDELVFSPRNKNSVETILSHYKKKPIRILFTVGVDNIDLLHFALENGLKRVEINTRKPVSTTVYLNYQSLISTLRKKDITLIEDGCIEYVSKGRDCHEPKDGILELTTYIDSNEFYTCAYPSNKCIAKLGKGK